MPMKKKSSRPRRAWKPKRRTGYRSNLAKSEFASVKETYQFATLDSNTAYRDMTISLARFNRAKQVAQGFQEYRITKVEYKWKPLVDTFAPGGGPVPYMYYLIDRTGSNSAITTDDQFIKAGCKSIRLDDKIITRSFKPAVLQYSLDAVQTTNLYSKPVISPWLTCNGNNTLTQSGFMASSVDHLGLEWIVLADNIKYQVEMTCHFQFRKPACEVVITPGVTNVEASELKEQPPVVVDPPV